MTPEQALRVLDDATSMISTTRANHEAMINALRTLQAALNAKPNAIPDVTTEVPTGG
jgi:hypothetical protein